MRLALAQIDTTVGDISGNAARAIDAIAAAHAAGADLTLLPELTTTGYPPEDLLAKEHFVSDNLEALERIAAACVSAALVGFVDREGGRLFNAAALCADGQVVHVYRKRHLPNYGVFDEQRYFAAGDEASVVDLQGITLAPTVCEDIWVGEVGRELAASGARLVCNISASPYHVGKGQERERTLCAQARDNGVWLAYCNLVGAQDELVFDGRSVLISPRGRVVARASAFAEDLLIAEFEPQGETLPDAFEPKGDDDAEVYAALVLGLHDYVAKNGFTDVVLGLSGGIDSALTAAIAADALGPAHVHGVMMPGEFSSAGSVDDSVALGESLGLDVREMRITGPFEAFREALAPSFQGRPFDVAEENLQARVRGTLLMALSNKFGWLTLATGNKSELSVGYSTLYGDMVGGFAPLKDVFKMRVYSLARWRNARDGHDTIPQSTIEKAPSAELRPDQRDSDSLPPYDVLDRILEAYVERDESLEQIEAAGFDRVLVARVVRMVDAAEYKRRQGPLGIKISRKAFGKDRRMPITNVYREDVR
ncbi:MAG: NAD+ synthase [Coriobacteriia bacterium]